MEQEFLIASLERFPSVLETLLRDLSPDDARYKPDSGAWSILEVVNHLADEEESDFPARLRSTVEDPVRKWAPIDPEGWAAERRYNERDLGESLARFAELRTNSLEWLRGANRADLNLAHKHPKLGRIRAGDLLAAWAAHDLLHLRQITKRLHELVERHAGSFSTGYAGEWTA